MLGADELILEAIRFRLRFVRGVSEAGRHRWRGSAIGLRQPGQIFAKRRRKRLGLGTHFAQQLRHDAVLLLHECQQQMLGIDLRVAHLFGKRLRRQNRFLGLFGKFIDIHS